MLSAHEIKQIVSATITAGREVFVTKEEFAKFLVEFRKLQTSVDNSFVYLMRHDDEIKIINHRLEKHNI